MWKNNKNSKCGERNEQKKGEKKPAIRSVRPAVGPDGAADSTGLAVPVPGQGGDCFELYP